ncbi:hypothetical protein KGA66_20240 [Actinocrinis puniceicyclus]|uniref:Uncharacterized protein n=1 Tax=Actinocrinis puniceicyclus TaxID=977794 RepID=A0A8J8BCR5_9ACTN|nr:hypothetical protein [Actinocrinis puniceicyclus]MBS2965392.1 hypothetical protein [Actinocrinis puniceicyclus]
MAGVKLTPDQEVKLIRKLLGEKGVADPESLGHIVAVWAIGLANGAWRNTVVEDWHAGDGPLSDGDMLRINSYTTRGIQRRLDGWMREHTLESEGRLAQLDDLEPEDIEELVDLLATWLTRPERRLPIGLTLAQLADAADSSVEDYAEDATEALDGFLAMVDERGPSFAFLRTAAHGAAACEHWWNHPRWPSHVDVFLAELRIGTNEHLERVGSRPETITDLASLQRLLLNHPWELDGAAAQWIADADIRYVVLHHDERAALGMGGGRA